jgi:isoaspartyl peptidase/L-asparaginase-like protein (Ntn-hydrolase superfamily)
MGRGPILVGSGNAEVGVDAGARCLASGGSALDAVELVTREVESNPSDHTVGFAGYPNLLGEVELDASIMDGTTRRGGGIGALKGYRHAITVARAVMERTPHVLVAGAGAARLAQEIGCTHEELLTPEVQEIWKAGIEGRLGDGDSFHRSMLARMVEVVKDPERVAGTVNVVAVDAGGRMACAVSSSGWAWKYPGRVGDSAVIGAGGYADDRLGAAACTGWGELAVRVSAARSVVSHLEQGVSVGSALDAVVDDLASLERLDTPVHLLAVTPTGEHDAVSTQAETEYVVWTPGAGARRRPRRVIDVQSEGGSASA